MAVYFIRIGAEFNILVVYLHTSTHHTRKAYFTDIISWFDYGTFYTSNGENNTIL